MAEKQVWKLSPPSPPSSTATSSRQIPKHHMVHPWLSISADIPMSVHHTRQRLPISCEPCRVRKIRCPRDGPACGTCVRRRVPLEQCVYSTRRKPQISSQPQPQQFQPRARSLEDRSSCPDTPVQQRYEGVAGEPNADLVARIEKLEKLLHAKNKHQETEQGKAQETVPPPLNVPQLYSEVEGRRISEPVTTITTGTLIPSEICDPDMAPRPDDPTTLQRLDAAIRVRHIGAEFCLNT